MNKRILLTLTCVALAAGCLIYPVSAGRGNGNNGGGNTPVISKAEAADLLFMREEEKLARDVYITLYDEWGQRVFENISQSEQRHMDAVLGLIENYSLEDPALDFGLFADVELQELYNTLIASGMNTRLDALMVGALIEEVDMEDIVHAMERTDKADILNVYANLLAGSENHLRAFVRNIEAITGETYVAQVLSQEEVDAILGR